LPIRGKHPAGAHGKRWNKESEKRGRRIRREGREEGKVEKGRGS